MHEKFGGEAVIFADVGPLSGDERIEIGNGQPVQVGNLQVFPELALIRGSRAITVHTQIRAIVAAVVIADGDFAIIIDGDCGQELIAANAAEILWSGGDGAKKLVRRSPICLILVEEYGMVV